MIVGLSSRTLKNRSPYKILYTQIKVRKQLKLQHYLHYKSKYTVYKISSNIETSVARTLYVITRNFHPRSNGFQVVLSKIYTHTVP